MAHLRISFLAKQDTLSPVVGRKQKGSDRVGRERGKRAPVSNPKRHNGERGRDEPSP